MIVCLGESLFVLNLFGDIWVSCTWMVISLPRFGKFSLIIALSKFSVPFSLFPTSKTPIMQICLFSVLPHNSFRLSSLFYYSEFFIFLWLNDIQISAFKLTDSFFCLIEPAVEATYWIFYFIFCILKLENFCLVLYYDFYFFVKLFILFIYLKII